MTGWLDPWLPLPVQVADFGISRMTGTVHHTESYGTITHMPPELLRDGVLTSSTDVWCAPAHISLRRCACSVMARHAGRASPLLAFLQAADCLPAQLTGCDLQAVDGNVLLCAAGPLAC